MTDIAPVGAIAARVMEGVGVPQVLIPNGTSPHDYAMRPFEAQALSQAQLVIWVSPELTRWLEGPLDALAGKAEHIAQIDGPLNLLPMRDGDGFEGGGHDHGQDADHNEDHNEDHDENHNEDHDADHDEEHANVDPHI
ncbi:hypothetical protein C1J03_14335 [Sulfitobacter sp. SK012]|nr:zinc ABC transporter substrate-binding protein [Sulfitobacter sp. SK012]AXI47090.1 hypothetical protein C1J03_14335 [Sulfitobacter sp. SK012]